MQSAGSKAHSSAVSTMSTYNNICNVVVPATLHSSSFANWRVGCCVQGTSLSASGCYHHKCWHRLFMAESDCTPSGCYRAVLWRIARAHSMPVVLVDCSGMVVVKV